MDNIFCWTLVILMVMVTLVSKVAAIECYSCSTVNDGDSCGEKGFSDSSKTMSEVGILPCKICTKIKGEDNGQEIVTRSCLHTAEKKNSGEYSGEECYCSKSLCNGEDIGDKSNGGNNNNSQTLLVSSLVLSAIVYVLWK